MRSTAHRGFVGFACLSLMFAASGCEALLPSNPIESIPTDELYLFVQTARAGTLSLVDATTDTYRLALENVNPNVVFFSDRPERDSGSMSVQGYIDEVFEPTESNPNAALVIEQANAAGQLTLALELSEPDYDPATGTLTYLASLLTDISRGLSHLSFDYPDALPTRFEAAELFIDSSSWHRCTLVLENDMDDVFFLELGTLGVDPPLGSDRWGKEPPAKIASGDSGSMLFRYHSDTDNKKASFGYGISAPDQSNITAIFIDLVCFYATVGGSQVNKEQTSCRSEANRFECKLDRLDGDTIHFKVKNTY